jgi:hypothetical protein
LDQTLEIFGDGRFFIGKNFFLGFFRNLEDLKLFENPDI